MATKANPGKYDCYGAMPDDEPHFVLRSTGSTSPGLVRIWAAIKAANFREAHHQLQILQKRRQAEMADGNHFDGAKVAEALLCANDMEIYAGKGEDVPQPDPVDAEPPAIDPNNPLDEPEQKQQEGVQSDA